MRIGFDLRTLIEGKVTGVETYTINLLRALLTIDQKNTYVLFANAGSTLSAIPEFMGANVEKRFFRFPNKLFNFSQRFLRYPKIDKLIGGVDVFFSPRFLFSALSRNCRIVITVHDLSFIRNPEFFSLKGRIWHKLVGDKAAAKNAAHIIAVSQSTKNDIIKYFGIPPQRISVVHSGISQAGEQTEIAPDKLQNFKTRNSINFNYFLFLGTFEPRKNLSGIIEAFEKFSANGPQNLHLILAGGLGWRYQSILNKITESKYRDKIHLLGVIPEEDKRYLYKSATATLFPSFYEGFGFPPLEAAYYGAPVITAYNSSLPEVMGDACVYVNPYDANQMAQAMNDVASDEAMRKNLIEKGVVRAKMFTWEKTARETLKIFESFKCSA